MNAAGFFGAPFVVTSLSYGYLGAPTFIGSLDFFAGGGGGGGSPPTSVTGAGLYRQFPTAALRSFPIHSMRMFPRP